MKQLTFSQYRKIDITLLCALTAVFEYVATIATNSWFSLQAMAVSITLSMTCITMFRWGALAVFPSLVGSLVYCIASGAAANQFVIYCVGSLFCIASLPLLMAFGKEKTKTDFFKRLFFTVVTYVSVAIGRWLVSLFYHFSIDSFIGFLIVDVISLLFAIIILSLLNNTDGMIEDQKSYLFRLERERKEEAENANDNF